MARLLATLMLVLAIGPAFGGDKNEVSSWIDKGLAHANKREFEAAERCYLKALELDKNNGATHGNLTFVYLNTNRYLKAVEAAAAAIRHGNKAPGVYLNRAEAFRRLAVDQKKYVDDALASCEQVIAYQASKLTPVTPDEVATAYEIKAAIFDMLKQPEIAREMRKKAEQARMKNR